MLILLLRSAMTVKVLADRSLAKKQFLRSLYYVINFYNHADPTLVTNYENLAKI